MCQEVLTNLERFLLRKTEIEIEQDGLETNFILNEFRYEESEADGNTYISIYDDKSKQKLSFDTTKILNILNDSVNTCTMVCELKFDNMSIVLSSARLYCCHCKSEIKIPYETKWSVSGYGDYSSHYDGEEINLKLCDSCLMELLEYKGGEICE